MYLYLPAMKTLRAMSNLRLWVLAWFVLSLGVAVASPIVRPQTMEVVCTTTGGAKIYVHTDDGTAELGALGMDCPLCLTAGAPPAALQAPLPGFPALAHKPQILLIAPAMAAMAMPPPARGPPFPLSLT